MKKILAWNEKHDPIDVFYFNGPFNAETPLRSICSYPHVATQGTSESDITPSVAAQMPAFSRHSANVLLNEIEKSQLPPCEATKVQALHPHWSGNILLSKIGNVAQIMGSKVFGRYTVKEDSLHLNWYRYGGEVFELDGDKYVFRGRES